MRIVEGLQLNGFGAFSMKLNDSVKPTYQDINITIYSISRQKF